MHRRDFIKLSTAVGVASALPLWSRFAFAQDYPALPIPPLLEPDSAGNVLLNIQTGSMKWKGTASTTTWGINGSFLGPAVRLQRGKQVNMLVNNQLAETTTLHWHGVEVPGTADGGPQAEILPGKQWTAQFVPDQPASTCWFHPHTHGKTGYQVAMGLGGLLILEDDESAKLPLPKTWGVDDVPVILQDKLLDEKGQIDYRLNMMTAAMGWIGNLMLTNGAIYPQHIAPRGWLRLRFLNGCNARSLNLTTSDKRPLYVIASDGGFLPEPVKLSEMPLLMGERFEVLVDASDGKPFDIVTLPVTQMGMGMAPFDNPVPVLRIQPSVNIGIKEIPDSLIKLPALPALDKLSTRWLQLMMNPMMERMGMQMFEQRYGQQSGGHMQHGMGMNTSQSQHGRGHMGSSSKINNMVEGHMPLHMASSINGVAFDMRKPLFEVKQGQYERWTISGEGDAMLHPFHIHGTQFRILSENGKAPAAHRSGWKDTVSVDGARSEVLVRFNHLAPPERAYMAHCHLLEHEDTGMMLAFTVKA